MRLLNKWSWGPWVACRCPQCGCDPDHGCVLALPDGESTASCVPAGAFRQRACSACLARQCHALGGVRRASRASDIGASRSP